MENKNWSVILTTGNPLEYVPPREEGVLPEVVVLMKAENPLEYRGGSLPDIVFSTAAMVQNLLDIKARELWETVGDPSHFKTPRFFFVNDPRFGACTHFDGATPTININITVLLVLSRLFQKALTSPRFFPGTKDCPSDEAYAPPPPGSWTLDLTLDITRTLEENCKAFIDPIPGIPHYRWILAQNLAELATLYIGFHELAHIVCGHTQFHVTHFGASSLHDFTGLGNSDPHFQETLRLWEVEADNIGAQLFAATVHALLQGSNRGGPFGNHRGVSRKGPIATFRYICDVGRKG